MGSFILPGLGDLSLTGPVSAESGFKTGNAWSAQTTIAVGSSKNVLSMFGALAKYHTFNNIDKIRLYLDGVQKVQKTGGYNLVSGNNDPQYQFASYAEVNVATGTRTVKIELVNTNGIDGRCTIHATVAEL